MLERLPEAGKRMGQAENTDGCWWWWKRRAPPPPPVHEKVVGYDQ